MQGEREQGLGYGMDLVYFHFPSSEIDRPEHLRNFTLYSITSLQPTSWLVRLPLLSIKIQKS